jgi:hypothetical protein
MLCLTGPIFDHPGLLLYTNDRCEGDAPARRSAGEAKRHRLEIGWRESARGFESLLLRLTTIWGGARVADWARLLSECTRKSTEGSNPSLPASDAMTQHRIKA